MCGAQDTRAERAGRGDKDGPSGAAPGSAPKQEAAVLEQRLRQQGPQTPRITKSSPARRLSPSHRRYWAPGPDLGHLRSAARPLPVSRTTARPAAVGLRTAPPPPPPPPAGSKRPGGRRVGRPSPRPVGQLRNSWPPLPPSSLGPRTLTPPTRSHTIPEASGARALCRSGAASRPGPEMAAEQRESGLWRARVRLAEGRGPPRERSAAVA